MLSPKFILRRLFLTIHSDSNAITEDFLSSPDVIDEAELSLSIESGAFLFEKLLMGLESSVVSKNA